MLFFMGGSNFYHYGFPGLMIHNQKQILMLDCHYLFTFFFYYHYFCQKDILPRYKNQRSVFMPYSYRKLNFRSKIRYGNNNCREVSVGE